ncbi:ABC transporter ATP-binding protein [uncultured Tessaracoccus sp.]|uniref:dipeptide ABC transporter ATP-binding protein n=1 Tax=uncultured Tessaracoccus sp. TaxID=905023 RepID=UPI0025E7A304|nr:ABC transporter ATP-binding protein [uncultured Tessaracoccus sp.]
MSLLTVRDLQVTFPSERGDVHAVRGVDLDLERGRTLCLVGESGSGKSATAAAINGLLPRFASVRGSVQLDGRELVGLSDREMSALRGLRIGMVFQDPLTALTPMFSVGRQLSDAVRVHQQLSASAAWRRAVELLDLVGIRDPQRRAKNFPHEFSGGMRQRVVIALAIANDPDLLIADEPTTALDVTVQAQILDVLRTAQRETGAGLLLITHDLGVVAGHADDVAVMYAGRIVERAPVDELFAHPRMPYTIGLLGALPGTGDARTPLLAIPGSPPQLLEAPTGCPFAARCPVVTEACLDGEPALVEAGASGHWSACVRAGELAAGTLDAAASAGRHPSSGTTPPAPDDAPDDGAPVLRVRGLRKTYPVTKGRILRREVGRTVAVRGVDLELWPGETHGLVGESGSGKTSTFMEIMGLREPEAGTVELLGHRVDAHLGREERRRLSAEVQLVMQDVGSSLSPKLTIFDVLAEPLQAHGWPKARIEARVEELLGLVGLDASVLDRFPSAFSGGQRQRIAIARALALDPRVVVLDEPVSALDMSVQADVLNLLVRLQEQLGIAMLVIAHDLAVVRHLSDRVSVMYLGTIVETAPADELFDEPLHPYTQALLSASPVPDPAVERSRERIVLVGEAEADPDDEGCVFRNRCPLYRRLDPDGQRRCRAPQPLQGDGHRVACHVATTAHSRTTTPPSLTPTTTEGSR